MIYDAKYDAADSSIYSKMYQASGLTLNGIGNFEMCNNINQGKYALIFCKDLPRYVLTFCGPKTCTEKDYKIFIRVFKQFNCYPKIQFPQEYQEKFYGKYTFGAINMLVFISFIICLALVSTVVDFHIKEYDERRAIFKILLCFSLRVN